MSAMDASDLAMQPTDTFASGRYSKRKRTPISYVMEELEVSDDESEFERPLVKKRNMLASSSRPGPKRKIFPFLQLPAEIRNMIYMYALADPSGINIVASIKNMRRIPERVTENCMERITRDRWDCGRMNRMIRSQYAAPVSLVPSLLRLCKQIHHEARDILYGNQFIFANSFALYCFFINLGPGACKYVKSLRLLGWGYSCAQKQFNHACFSAMTSATNIEKFQIDPSHGCYRAKWGGAEQLYRDAFPWMEAFGAAKGKPDAVVDILHFGQKFFLHQRYGIEPSRPMTPAGREEVYREGLRKKLRMNGTRTTASSSKKIKF